MNTHGQKIDEKKSLLLKTMKTDNEKQENQVKKK